MRPDGRFLGLTRLLPSVHGLAAVGLSGGGTVSGVACTRAARNGPAGFPHGDARWPKEQERRYALVPLRSPAPTGSERPRQSGVSLAGSPGAAPPRAAERLGPWSPGASCQPTDAPKSPSAPSPASCTGARPSAWSAGASANPVLHTTVPGRARPTPPW